MRTIHKYVLKITDSQEIVVPEGTAFSHVGVQKDSLCLWAEVRDTDAQPMKRIIRIFGTGNPVDVDFMDMFHLGTVQMGPFVWHVYEQHEYLVDVAGVTHADDPQI